MQACYAANVTFTDPAFPGLTGKQAGAMWHMLCLAGKDMQITFTNITATENTGSADWVAVYTFSLTGKKVTNHVHARFEFADGKILAHTDTFNFWKWARQAFGITGLLLGCTPFFKNKVQATTRQRLQAFIQKNAEYQG